MTFDVSRYQVFEDEYNLGLHSVKLCLPSLQCLFLTLTFKSKNKYFNTCVSAYFKTGSKYTGDSFCQVAAV